MNVRIHRNALLMVVGLGAALLLSACRYVEVDGVGTRTPDDLHPPQADVVAFDGCSAETLNRWRASGELVNNTDRVVTYEIVVAFDDGDVRLDQRSEWIRDVGPGDRVAVNRAWWIDEPERVTSCRVLTVNRFG